MMAEFKDNDIEIRAVTSDDVDGVRATMHSMCAEEPLSRAVNLKTPEVEAGLDLSIPMWLGSGLSLVAVDKRTNEIIGFRMSMSVTRKFIEDNRGKYIFDAEKMPKMHALELMWEIVEKNPTYILDYYKTDTIVRFFGLHVKPAYCRRGIASRLVDRAIREAKEKGHTHIWTEASSNYSRKVFENAGFETLNEITYNEYRRMGFEFGDTGVHDGITLHGLELGKN